MCRQGRGKKALNNRDNLFNSSYYYCSSIHVCSVESYKEKQNVPGLKKMIMHSIKCDYSVCIHIYPYSEFTG